MQISIKKKKRMRLRASKDLACTVKEANRAESIGQTRQLEIHAR